MTLIISGLGLIVIIAAALHAVALWICWHTSDAMAVGSLEKALCFAGVIACPEPERVAAKAREPLRFLLTIRNVALVLLLACVVFA